MWDINGWDLFKANIEGRAEVSLKRYLYVLRPLFCIRWVAQNGAPPPTALADLLCGTKIAEDVSRSLETILTHKRAGGESTLHPPDATLDAFIRDEIATAEARVAELPDPRAADDALNALLQELLGVA